VRFFRRLSSELNFTPANLQVLGTQPPLSEPQDKDLIDSIKQTNGFAISHAYANRQADQNAQQDNRFSVAFQRGRPTSNTIEPSLTVDTVRIDSIEKVSAGTALKISQIIEEELIVTAAIPLPGADASTLADLVLVHRELILKLNQQSAEISEQFTKKRLDLEEEIASRKTALEEKFDEDRAKLAEEQKIQQDRLDAEREALNQDKKRLDDRDNTHVRRELRQNLNANLADYKTNFELSKGTRDLRRPVGYVVGLIEAACVGLLVFFFVTMPLEADVWERAFFWAKTVTLTFFAAGTAVWYLKWLTQWSSRHADGEFQLRQLELDIDRASWVVETAFEWKSSQESSIPQPLLDAITRNLFASGEARIDTADSPADHLASALLGDASKVKLKFGDYGELEMDRSAIKRAQRPHGTS
jgi:hypothetical protein